MGFCGGGCLLFVFGGHMGEWAKSHKSLQILKFRGFVRFDPQIQCCTVKYISFTLDAYSIHIKEAFEKEMNLIWQLGYE